MPVMRGRTCVSSPSHAQCVLNSEPRLNPLWLTAPDSKALCAILHGPRFNP